MYEVPFHLLEEDFLSSGQTYLLAKKVTVVP